MVPIYGSDWMIEDVENQGNRLTGILGTSPAKGQSIHQRLVSLFRPSRFDLIERFVDPSWYQLIPETDHREMKHLILGMALVEGLDFVHN